MEVSVIIVNYNTKELLDNCIQSVYEKTKGIEYEIIVVDNASVDGSQQMISEKYPDVKLIELEENIGFGRANNEGVKVAEGEYLLFLNSDTQLKNNALKFFFDFMKSKSALNVGAIGTLLLNSEEKVDHSSGLFPNPLEDILIVIKSYFFPGLKKSEKLFFKENEMSFEVDYIIGADMFISINLFKKLGGFDARFFMYYEETDLQLGIDKLGMKRLLIKGPEIIHFEGSSFKIKDRKSNLRRILLDRSHFLYLNKNYRYCTYIAFRLIYALIRLVTVFDFSYSIKERAEYIKNLLKPI